MGVETGIEWTDRTWNPVVGCSIVSPGCHNCYAMTMAKRLRAMALADVKAGRNPGRKRHYVDSVNDAGRWTGKLMPVRESLDDPKSWKTPQMVFVNSMSDLFHESVPDEFIDQVFDVIWQHPQHTFQVLTKRADRAANYMLNRASAHSFGWTAIDRDPLSPLNAYHHEDVYYRNQCGYVGAGDDEREWVCDHPDNDERGENCSCSCIGCPIAEQITERKRLEEIGVADDYEFDDEGHAAESSWMEFCRRPRSSMPQNLWLGFSAENQVTFNERSLHFRKLRYMSPYLTLFCSAEPLIGPISTQVPLPADEGEAPQMWDALSPYVFSYAGRDYPVPHLNWVIIGGESGRHARPCNVYDVMALVRQCREAGVPAFVKQLGSHCVTSNANYPEWPEETRCVETNILEGFAAARVMLRDSKGGDPAEWPEDLRVREFPKALVTA